MRRIALALTSWPYRVREMVGAARLAEERGYEMVWSAEDYFTGRDGITPLACYAYATERVKLGTCVIGPYTRTPGMIAATMSTLDELSDGRIVLGLGAGLGWAAMYPGKEERMRSVGMMRDTVQLVRDLFAKKTAAFRGKTMTIRGDPYWWPDGVVRPPRGGIPIYLGSRGPRMLRLAAEVSDGLIIELGVPAPMAKERIERFRSYAERAGREPDELDVVCIVCTSVSEGGGLDETARRLVASRIRRLGDAIYPIELSGVDEGEAAAIRSAYERGGLGEASRLVTEEHADPFMAFGTREECVRKLEEYVAAGVKQPIIFPMGRDLDEEIRMGEMYAGRPG